MAKRFNWDEDVPGLIDWEAHRRAHAKLSSHKNSLVKFVHNLSPVGKQQHRINPACPPFCTACKTSIESCDHLYQCGNQSRSAWRDLTVREMQNKMTSIDTEPTLVRLILQGICLAHQSSTETLDEFDYPNSYHPAIRAQNKIGWQHFLRGRWSTEWTSLQRHHLLITGITDNRTSSDKWAPTLISTYWRYWLRLWQLRNEQTHGADSSEQATRKREQIHREMDQLYSLKNSVLSCDRDFFHDNLDKHKSMYTSQLQTWIHNYSGIIKRSVREAATKSINNTLHLGKHFEGRRVRKTKVSRRPPPHTDTSRQTTLDQFRA